MKPLFKLLVIVAIIGSLALSTVFASKTEYPEHFANNAENIEREAQEERQYQAMREHEDRERWDREERKRQAQMRMERQQTERELRDNGEAIRRYKP